MPRSLSLVDASLREESKFFRMRAAQSAGLEIKFQQACSSQEVPGFKSQSRRHSLKLIRINCQQLLVIMQAPLCEVCLQSEILCSGCSAKLAEGKISQTEIDASRFLHGLAERHTQLADAKLIKIVDADHLIFIAARGDAPKFVGRQGSVVKELARKFGKNIKILEEADFKNFASNLVQPAVLSGINIIYSPEGEKIRVRVSRGKPNISSETFSQVVSSIFGKRAELVLES